MQKQEKKFFEGHWSTFWIKMPFGIGHPPHLHINCSLHVWGRAQGSQIFKRNSIISIHSKVMAFLVILLSPHGPHRPRVVPVIPTSSHCPHIIPTLSTSSPSSSCCPHSPQKVPMWSPWSVVSTCCPRRPCHPHVIPTSSPLSSCCPHSPQKVPMWSPWSVVSTCCPHHPRHPHVIPTSSRRSPHHPQLPKYPVHSPPPPWRGGGSESVKMQ